MSDTNFLGIPIAGDINRGEKRKEQRPLSELAPLMQAVLNDPNVVEFGWKQYTPYFNDGDPCYFGVGEMWAKPDTTNPLWTDVEENEYYTDGFAYDHETWGNRPKTWNQDTRTYTYGPYEGPDVLTYDRLDELDQAIQSGAFDDVLLDAFGDHAEVIVTKDKISIEEYSHD